MAKRPKRRTLQSRHAGGLTQPACNIRRHPRKQFRGLGIARAVKLESIGQAIELGKHSITTNNDLENAAILHINSTLGYQPLPGLVTYVKSLTS